MGDTIDDNWWRECQTDNNFFKSVIDLIPPMFYFDAETKSKLKELTYSSVSQGSSGKGEYKQSKYDPKTAKSVSEVQEHLLAQEHQDAGRVLSSGPAKKAAVDDTSLKSATDSLEELREKLHRKLQVLKDKRRCMRREDWLERRQLKRRAGRVRSKLRKSGEVREPPAPAAPPQLTSPHKPIYNNSGKLVFSKFDFTESKPDNRETQTGKNYKHLLEKVQKQKEKCQQLRQVDQDKAQQLETKTKWNTVMQKAQGVKVKDNEELLKKALKRKEKLKNKSKKQWEARQEKVDLKMKERQDKRKTNISKKKHAKVDKKLKKAKKKGRVFPGF